MEHHGVSTPTLAFEFRYLYDKLELFWLLPEMMVAYVSGRQRPEAFGGLRGT